MITHYILEIRENRNDELLETWYEDGDRGFIQTVSTEPAITIEIGHAFCFHDISDAREALQTVTKSEGYYAAPKWPVIILPLNEYNEYEIRS